MPSYFSSQIVILLSETWCANKRLALLWAQSQLHTEQTSFYQQLISKGSPGTFKFNGTLTFIDDLCTINDDSEFFSSYKYIYPKQLELKLEHQEEHATFLDLGITVANNIFVYKLFDERGKFPFIVVRMPYLLSNIPSSIFYGSIFFN